MLRKLCVSWLVLLLMGTSAFAYDKIEHVTAAWPLLTIEYRSQSSSVEDVRLKVSGTDKTIQPQKIEKKQVSSQQNLLIAVDTSRNLTPEYLSSIKEALRGYVQNGTADSTAILSFNKIVQLHSAFTSDKQQLLDAVKRLRKGEADSALFSTIDFAISLLQQHEGYNTLLVMTDGNGDDSNGDITSVTDKALEKGVVINVLCLSKTNYIGGSASAGSLKKLAEGTGGTFEVNSSPEALSFSVISRLGKSNWQLPAYKIVFDLSGVNFSHVGNTECVLTENAENEEITSNFFISVPDSAVKGEKTVTDYIPSASQTVTKLLNNKIYLYSAIGCGVVILLIIALVLTRKKRTKQEKRTTVPALPEQEGFSNFIIEFQAIGMTFPLPYGRVTIGKSKDNAIILGDPTVSRHHGAIQVTRDALLIEDLKSTNGIFVNKVRVSHPVHLKPGDKVLFGKTEAVIRQK